MDEELRDKVAVEIMKVMFGGADVKPPVGVYNSADAILSLIAFVRVREQREAFCAGYRATCPDCAEAEAARRYPDA